MSESAEIALSFVRSHREELGIDASAFENRRFHVHVPAGAVPKDGPSAGHHDDDRAREPAHGPAGAAGCRDDRRGHAAGPGAADRWAEAEGARGAPGRAHRRGDPVRQRRRSRRRARSGPRRDHFHPVTDVREVLAIALEDCRIARCRQHDASHVVPAKTRMHTEIDWLDSWHSFSFGEHYDPDNTHHGLLLVSNDDLIAPAAGSGPTATATWRSSRGCSTARCAHQDSIGTNDVITPGLAQRMSAGTGIRHSEVNASATEPVHLVQMWVPPDTQGLTPELRADRRERPLAEGGLVAARPRAVSPTAAIRSTSATPNRCGSPRRR